jgi:hypothetical protein
MEISTKAVLPKFDGKREYFQVWLMRFMAYATVMQFVTALDRNKAGLPVSETATIDERTAGGKKLAAAVKANLQAMACFTMVFTKASLLLLVAKAKTAERPSGLAYLVLEAFKKVHAG